MGNTMINDAVRFVISPVGRPDTFWEVSLHNPPELGRWVTLSLGPTLFYFRDEAERELKRLQALGANGYVRKLRITEEP